MRSARALAIFLFIAFRFFGTLAQFPKLMLPEGTCADEFYLSPDGQKIVTSEFFSLNAFVREATSGRLIAVLRGVKFEKYHIGPPVFSQDGRRLLIGNRDVWDVYEEKKASFGKYIGDVDACDREGRYLSFLKSKADEYEDELVAVPWEITIVDFNQALLIKQIWIPAGLRAITGFSADGSQLVVLRSDSLMQVYSVPDGEKVREEKFDGSEKSLQYFDWQGADGLDTDVDPYNRVQRVQDGFIWNLSTDSCLLNKYDQASGKLLLSIRTDGDHSNMFDTYYDRERDMFISSNTLSGEFGTDPVSHISVWRADKANIIASFSMAGECEAVHFNDRGDKALIVGGASVYNEKTGEQESWKAWQLWNMEKGKCMYRSEKADADRISWSTDGRFVVAGVFSGSKMYWKVMDSTGKVINSMPESRPEEVVSMTLSPQANRLILSYADNTSDIREFPSLKTIRRVKGIIPDFLEFRSHKRNVFFGNNMLTFDIAEMDGAYDVAVYMYNLSSGELLMTKKEMNYFEYGDLSPDGKKIVEGFGRVFDLRDDDIGMNIPGIDIDMIMTAYSEFPYFSPRGDQIIAITGDGGSGGISMRTVSIWDTQTSELRFGEKDQLDISYINDDATLIYTFAKEGDSCRLIRLADRSSINMEHAANEVLRVFFTWDNRYLYTQEYNVIKKWDTRTGQLCASYFSVDSSDFLVMTPDHYYTCPPRAARLLHFVDKDFHIISFDQLDTKYNRPDKVLAMTGNTDSLLARSYELAFWKRIRRLHIDTALFTGAYSIPQASILNGESLQEKVQSNRRVALQVSGSDNFSYLERFNVWINEVPVYGSRGFSLAGRRMKTIDTLIYVDLVAGLNKVQVSVSNGDQMESYRKNVTVRYLPDKQNELPEAKTWFIGIGVSQYKDSSYNLTYAVKDIQDLKATFPGAEVTTLLNEQATKENILALKQKLLQTNIEDKVIISVSGHGVLSDSLDFYFATHDMDFQHPEKRGLLFDDLEGLLDSIPARKKLLMIDACHSGEVDKDEMKLDTTLLAADHVIVKGNKGGQTLVNKNSIGLQNTFELMQSLFANVSKGTGAVVISAAGGKEYALESGKWNNGVFTYCVRKALEEKAADANNDSEVTITELKDYVSKEVERLTQGRQKPTARKENLEVDWRVK